MTRLISITFAVFTFFFMTHSHAGLFDRVDPSQGACDPYNGTAKVVCLQAHGTSDYIDRLNARIEGQESIDWWTLWKLDRAERRLDGYKNLFLSLTGEEVPGLGQECPFTPVYNSITETVNDGGEKVCLRRGPEPGDLEFLIICEDFFCPDTGATPYYYFNGSFKSNGCVEVGYPDTTEPSCSGEPIVDGGLSAAQFNSCAVDFGCGEEILVTE